MKQIKLYASAFAIFLFSLTACKDQFESEANQAQVANTSNQKKSAQPSAQALENLARLQANLPTLSKAGLKPNSKLLIHENHGYPSMARRALNAVEATPCDANTKLDLWLDQQLHDWNGQIISLVRSTAMLDLPTYDALVFENSSANQYYGAKGEYTQKLTKTFKDLKRFWNIQTDEMVMVAMHGNMLLNRERLIRTYRAVYGLDQSDAEFFADYVVEIVNAFPQLRNGNHPIFTFNAFALEGFSYPPFATIPDKIVMGDGIMEGFAAIGFGDVAPQAILAHEFGHQIQFQLGMFGGEKTAEATRRTELMADAYAAYYLSHARGATMQWKRVQQFLQVFFNIGDCGFTSDGHHGTPTQRMAAAQWGYNLANNAQKQGHILSSQEFAALFDAQLSQLVMR